MYSFLIDMADRAFAIDARKRSGFRPAPDRLQEIMPTPAMAARVAMNLWLSFSNWKSTGGG